MTFTRTLFTTFVILLSINNLPAEQWPDQAAQIENLPEVFGQITNQMAKLGYQPSDAPETLQENWQIQDGSEYQWFYKTEVLSEIPYVLIFVKPTHELSLLVQLELDAMGERPMALAYRDEMSNIGKQLKDVSKNLKHS